VTVYKQLTIAQLRELADSLTHDLGVARHIVQHDPSVDAIWLDQFVNTVDSLRALIAHQEQQEV
jgi:hypothetical protein